jgi:UDP-N-acetylglucosamine 1-carboxyvinyltransferase
LLNGVIPIAGAKNACLTLMPATLLTRRAADADQCAAPVGHPHHDAASAIAGRRGAALQGGQVLALSSHDVTSHTRRL